MNVQMLVESQIATLRKEEGARKEDLLRDYKNRTALAQKDYRQSLAELKKEYKRRRIALAELAVNAEELATPSANKKKSESHRILRLIRFTLNQAYSDVLDLKNSESSFNETEDGLGVEYRISIKYKGGEL